MSRAAHTPGPWGWWTSCSWRRLTSKDENGSWLRQGNVLCPVVASDGHPDLVVSPADMALIEAAPDLLDACQVALGHMTGGMDGDWRDTDPIELLRSAISKATPSAHTDDRPTTNTGDEA